MTDLSDPPYWSPEHGWTGAPALADYERELLRYAQATDRAGASIANAAGPWIPVTEREPENGAVVLGRWRDGAVRVVEWSPKSFERKLEGGHRPGDSHVTMSIYMAHIAPAAIGFREWPTHWAALREAER